MNDKDDRTETPKTSDSLLCDIAAHDDSPRWDEFAKIYGPVLRRYADDESSGSGLNPECESDDLVQEVFLTVKSVLPGFRYDPKKGLFRAFLHKIVHNKVRTLRKKRSKDPIFVDGAVLESSESDGDGKPAPEFDRELALRVWSQALALVFSEVDLEPNTKAVYRRLVLEGRSAESVSREFNMTPNAVYQIKNRVNAVVRKKLLRAAHNKKDLDEILEAFLSRRKNHQ